uniref:Uncharacterized protein n=1 Tax=Micrurus surinamensis TaxID=129470 RepID=A0A2D4PY01_MICSU
MSIYLVSVSTNRVSKRLSLNPSNLIWKTVEAQQIHGSLARHTLNSVFRIVWTVLFFLLLTATKKFTVFCTLVQEFVSWMRWKEVEILMEDYTSQEKFSLS